MLGTVDTGDAPALICGSPGSWQHASISESLLNCNTTFMVSRHRVAQHESIPVTLHDGTHFMVKKTFDSISVVFSFPLHPITEKQESHRGNAYAHRK